MTASLRELRPLAIQSVKLVFWNRLAVLVSAYFFAFDPDARPSTEPFSSSPFLSAMLRWDSAYYFLIARDGYNNIPRELGQRDTNFWPVFPWLWRLAHVVIPSWAISGLVLNFALLVVAVMAVTDIARRTLTARAAELAPLLLLIHPFAFYYSAYYTEATFVCFASLSLALAYRRKWAWACLAAGCAAGTRMVGLACGMAVALAYFENIRFDRKKIDRQILWLPLCALGLVAYVAYLQINFHDPLAFTAGLKTLNWGGNITWDRFTCRLVSWTHPSHWPLHWLEATDLSHVLVLAGTALTLLLGFRKLPPSLVLYAVVTMLISSRIWTATGRYCAPIFPAMLVLASWLESRPNLLQLFLSIGYVGTAIVTWMYIHGFWVS